jgi:hypothetical protein
MTVSKEFTRNVDGKNKRYALWKCSKCGDLFLKKLSWRQIKYRDDEEYRNYTKKKMREIYCRKKKEKLQSS